MTTSRSADDVANPLPVLCALPREIEWSDFKVNEAEHQVIPEDMSARANSAVLVGVAFAYLTRGVRGDDIASNLLRYRPLGATAQAEGWR